MTTFSWQFNILILNRFTQNCDLFFQGMLKRLTRVFYQEFSYTTIVTQSSIVNQVYLICADLDKLQEVQP
ncbi:hypothetical protein CUN59_02845 [Cuspidothrix issatschenkoi CHARLIE-1]|uniref:Uncharacterized protein n=1 Tax=Cuspidothrix issatschenkoi CHARLIE-1 TaxID=2052836 RepID=A0A2S6CYI7_9CYAN|nr:hypothetical protein CUN59_02845 [Cuspidothrix issatschenkoi CHARLIE-1]